MIVNPGTTQRLATGYNVDRLLACREFLSKHTADFEFCHPLDIATVARRRQGEPPLLTGKHSMVPCPDDRFGFGGKCLAKDEQDLFELSLAQGVPMRTIQASLAINAQQCQVIAEAGETL